MAVLLVSTGAEIVPDDSLLSLGPVELTASRLLILAGFAALLYGETPTRSLFRSRLEIPIALLLALGFVATLKWGTEPRFRFLVESVALFYLAFAVVRSRPEARTALVAVALVALSLSALTGVAQVSGDEATGFYRDGCTPVTRSPPDIPPGTITRARGSFENPNLLAAHVVLLAPLAAVAVPAFASALTLRLMLGLAVGLGYLGLVLTYSRAAVFMAFAGLGAALATSKVRYRRELALAGVALALGSSFLLATCGSEATSGFGRTEEWRETVRVMADNPVYGVGLGRAGDVLRARDERSSSRHAHNLFLNWGAEAGPAAMLAWIWLFAALLWWSLRLALRGDRLGRGALVALLGFLGVSMLDHPANVDRIATAFWIVAGMTAALAAGREEDDA